MAVTLGNGTVTFPDSTTQTGAYSTTTDQGQLISITTYSSGVSTYTAPANCRFVLVKLQAGGGGSAGYCESMLQLLAEQELILNIIIPVAQEALARAAIPI